jgi:ATP-binding cassette subfamily B protein
MTAASTDTYPRPRLRQLGAELRPHWRLAARGALFIVLETAAITCMPVALATTLERGVVGHDTGWVLAGTLCIALLTGIQVSSSYVHTTSGGRLAQDYLAGLRRRLLGQLYDLDLDYFGREPAGKIVARMTSDVDSLQQFVEVGLSLALRATMLVTLTITTMLLLSVPLTLAVMCSLGPLVAASLWYRSRSYRAQLLVRERNAEVLSHANESLNGVKVVQAYAVESARYKSFENVNGQSYSAQLRAQSVAVPYQMVVDVLGPAGLAVVVGLGAYLVTGYGLAVGTVVAFSLYLGRLFEPIQQAIELASLLQAATASYSRIFAFLGERPLVADADDAKPFVPGAGEVRVEGVSFSYPGREGSPVVADIDLAVQPGERVALVGDSGAGKTTLAKLISRTYDPDEGRVLVDGQDLRSVQGETLSQSLTLVAQEGFLFDGTVGENIAMAKPGATEDDAKTAAAELGILERLEALPDGMDTRVTNGGHSLSAGQRQLVALTRAMVAEPKVLILDEATSNLDPATDALVETAMTTLFEGRTAIVIAHRVSTVLKADRVVVLEDGAIAESGPPLTLLHTEGPFARWALQSLTDGAGPKAA